MKKRLLALCLSLLLIFSMLPVTAGAAEIASGTCGKNVTWTLGYMGTLTISGTGEMFDYPDEGSAPWAELYDYFFRVNVEDGVTSIGDYAFSSCFDIIHMTLPATLTSIGKGAFQNCTSLSSVSVPEHVTDIGSFAFSGCTELQSAQLPSALTSLSEGLFAGCSALTEVNIPAGVTEIGTDAFRSCCCLTAAALPAGLRVIGDYAFFQNSMLTSIQIPASVSEIGAAAFADLYNLKEIQVDSASPYFTTDSFGTLFDRDMTRLILALPRLKGSYSVPSSVTSIDPFAFYCCADLSEVAFPDSLTAIGDYAFYHCAALSEVAFPDSLTAIGDYAFSGCTGLTAVDLPAAVCEIGLNAFYECSAIKSLTVDPANRAYRCDPSGVLYSGDLSLLVKAPITLSGDYTVPAGVSHISAGAFESCGKLTRVILPDGVTGIGAKAFYACTGILCVEIPATMEVIGESAFTYCIAMLNVYFTGTEAQWGAILVGGDNERLTGNNLVFEASYGDNVVLERGPCGSDTVWSVTADGTLTVSGTGAMTDYCYSFLNPPWYARRDIIKHVVIEQGVTYVGTDAFSHCTDIVRVDLPDSLTATGSGVFSGCTALAQISLPESLTAIANLSFSDCSSLTDIQIPATVTSIGDSAFSGCSGLTEITVPDGVTSIGTHAFSHCTALTTLTLPKSVDTISTAAFSGCTALTEVYYTGSQAEWNEISLWPENKALTDAHIHYAGGEIQTVASGACGGNLTWTLDDAGTLTVSGTGDMNNYANRDAQTAPWYDLRESIDTVVTAEGVTSIGDCAFINCVNLEKAQISNTVQSIGSSAFYGCSNLDSPGLPYSLTEIGDSAFFNCSALGVINVPYTVTSIGSYAYYGCTGLTRALLPDGLTEIGDYTFSGCTSLRDIPFPRTVTSIGNYAFSGCTALDSIGTSEGLTSIGVGAFSNCTAMHSIALPYTLTSIGDSAFADCTALKNVNYSGTSAQWSEIFIGSNNEYLTGANISCAGDRAPTPFSGGCGSDVYWELKSDGTLTISGTGAIYDYTSSGAPWNQHREDILRVIIQRGVTGIGEHAFSGCTNATSIGIPDTVRKIGKFAFSSCSSLPFLSVPNGVTVIEEETFAYCVSLTGVTLPPTLTKIDSKAFWNCSSLTELTIPDGVTCLGPKVIAYCTGLTEISLPASVADIQPRALGSCPTLTAIHVDENNQHYSSDSHGVLFNKDKTQLVQAPGALIRYVVPDSVTSLGPDSFFDCTSLKFIELPAGLTVIPMYAFADCTSLTSITIPEGVFMVCSSAFQGCTALTEVYLPVGLTELGTCAFLGCSALTDVYYGGTKAQWDAIPVTYHNNALYHARIHYSAEPPDPPVIFTDVPAGTWYYDAVYHAVDKGVTTGTGANIFSPDMDCTRSQVVTFLYRAAGSPEVSGENPFTDVSDDAWYYKAVLWAVGKGITSGTTATTFAPDMPCSRSQVVTFLYRAAGAPDVSGSNPFSDVTEGSWYYNAVLWAVEKGITSGTTATTFAPDMTCSRSQVVTFLYRVQD